MSVIPYLPLEMMEQIFEHVKDSQDFHNVTNSSGVLPILLNEVNLSNYPRGVLLQLLTHRHRFTLIGKRRWIGSSFSNLTTTFTVTTASTRSHLLSDMKTKE
ncbi:unnamed protein product [Orchesella dallaii]|uniref:F-box domain-containing protein n=1 Tax=Orchesella dallaii TaxID=48710 RepID=A0ABP1S0T3_9HEXA